MTVTPTPVRDHALPARFAVVGGATNACSVGSFALVAAGHGIAAWALMIAAVVAMLAVRLDWRGRVDGSPVGTSLGAAGLLVAVLALVLAGGFLARAVARRRPVARGTRRPGRRGDDRCAAALVAAATRPQPGVTSRRTGHVGVRSS